MTKAQQAILAFAEAEDFGAELRRRREDAGVKPEELAVWIGVNPSTIWRWENNRGLPDIRQAGMIAEALRTRASVNPGLSMSLFDLDPPASGDPPSGDTSGLLDDLREAAAQMRERNRDMADTA